MIKRLSLLPSLRFRGRRRLRTRAAVPSAGNGPSHPKDRGTEKWGTMASRLARWKRAPRAKHSSQTVVCREGWYYVVLSCMVFGAAMLREVNLMLILGGMLFGPLLFNWRLTAVTLRGLDVRRTVPGGICAGDLLVVRLELSNTRRRIGCWAVNVRERIVREGDPAAKPFGVTEYFSYVAAGGRQVRTYQGRLPQRGRYRWEQAEISTRFPFGLFRREVSGGTSNSVLVCPRLGRLTHGWLKRRHESFDGTHRREQGQSRISGDLYGVREWRYGDSRRWIHWRSTARHGSLVVRQFEQHRNRDVAVLLDLWQPENPSMGDLENVELAVSFTATVMAEVCRSMGCNVLLGVPADEPRLLGGTASAVLLQDAMTRLALAQASPADRLPPLLEQAFGRIDPGTEVVVVSTRPVALEDAGRFGHLWQDSSRRAWLRHIRVVTTAEDDLNRFFQPE
jgi:uncharacterized protein (DUF58 family)